jgi:hypothetical protein
MRFLILAAFAVATMLSGGGAAHAAAPCSPFTSFPLVLNFGSGINTGTGEDLNCFAKKVQASLNSLAGRAGVANGLATLGSDGTLSAGQLPPAIGANTAAISTLLGRIGAANGIASLGPDGRVPSIQLPALSLPKNFLTLNVTNGCASTDGAFATDGTSSWQPSCFGTFVSTMQDIQVYPTRGTGKDASGNPSYNMYASSLIQAQGSGAVAHNTNGQFINLETVGGSVSNTSFDSTNSVGQLISVRQRPGPSGERPPTTWGGNIDFHIAPNSGGAHSYGFELDLNNFNANCSIGTSCISAWYFYGGINPFPNLAFHYFGNPNTQSFTGTVTTSGNTFTRVSGTINPLVTTLNYAGTTYRVTCTTTTCTTDIPLGTNSTPGAFTAYSAMAHYGLFFQDGPNGTQVQDADFLMADSARAIVQAQGRHFVGLDFTNDVMPNAAFLSSGQNVCYNGQAACMSYSVGLNSWLFQTGQSQGTNVARIGADGTGTFTNVIASGSTTVSTASIGTAGTTQATAAALTASATDIVVGTASQGVRLAGNVGFRQEVFNSSGVTINIYPGTGQQIGTAGANAPVSLAFPGHAAFICFSTTQCRQAP